MENIIKTTHIGNHLCTLVKEFLTPIGKLFIMDHYEIIIVTHREITYA